MRAQRRQVKKLSSLLCVIAEQALTQGNIDGARIYAENAIRKKNESLNYLRFAGKLDAVRSRLQTANSVKQMTKNMNVVVKSLESALSDMNLEKVSKIMDKFEKEFQDLDVHTAVLEGSIATTTTLSAPQEQIDSLIRQVAEENGLDIAMQLPSVTPAVAERAKEEEDVLRKRYLITVVV
ncbi:unnamed protein product [Soboliphyme baturini]|uniref:Charged multivesicular body protein 1a n=1 Tax=Soboliphyme baturini TaxID=241478 RepID=A0A183J7G2_9BILA|nr:unnamed protein product [Soboliphyme baturini]